MPSSPTPHWGSFCFAHRRRRLRMCSQLLPLSKMARSRRLKKRPSPLRRGRVSFFDRALDADTFRDTIGTATYDRVMQWNDSGAAEALQVAEHRKKAGDFRKPCWVPKLSDDLYIGNVDWSARDFGEVCKMPKSAVEFADASCGEVCGTPSPSFPRESEQEDQSSPALDLREQSNKCYDQHILEGSIDNPLMVESVLEPCADGLRLLVGGWPVEPSGWDEEDSEVADGPWIVDAVLEDFEDGQRLLVGGWPVQPSWDELDANWSQLGWEGHAAKPKCWDFMQGQSSWNGLSSVCFSQQQSGWQNLWCPGDAGKVLHQGQNFMMAF